MKIDVILHRGLLAAMLFSPLAQTFGQTATPPFLTITDFGTDGTTSPLLLLTGGQSSSTLGMEITSQSASSAGSGTPPWSTIMPMGFGGLSLVQTGAATSGAAAAAAKVHLSLRSALSN